MQNKYRWAAIAIALFIPSIFFASQSKAANYNPALQNLKAFLWMIQYAEGTYGMNAYRMLFGGSLFNSFNQHPNTLITKYGITSTAAGAYQLLYNTWTILQQDLQLPDFGELSQDRAAVELIKRKGAFQNVLSGRIVNAIYQVRKVWASLPGAGYGQNEKNIESLLQFYLRAGGKLNT